MYKTILRNHLRVHSQLVPLHITVPKNGEFVSDVYLVHCTGLLPLDSPWSGCGEECVLPEHCLGMRVVLHQNVIAVFVVVVHPMLYKSKMCVNLCAIVALFFKVAVMEATTCTPGTVS